MNVAQFMVKLGYDGAGAAKAIKDVQGLESAFKKADVASRMRMASRTREFQQGAAFHKQEVEFAKKLAAFSGPKANWSKIGVSAKIPQSEFFGPKANWSKIGVGGNAGGVPPSNSAASPALWSELASQVYLAGQAFSFVKGIIGTVLEAGWSIGKTFIAISAHAFDFGQSMRLGFGALLDNPDLGSKVFDQTRVMAQRLGLSVEDTTDSMRKLLAAQFTVGQSTELVKASADLQAIGASADDVKHALLAISQVKMKGKLQAEELTRQLANAGVSSELVYNAIAKRMGMPTDAAHAQDTRNKLLALQREGGISSDVAIPAIVDAIKEKTHSKNAGDAAALKADNTVKGRFMQLQGAFTNFFGDIAKSVETPVNAAAVFVLSSLSSIFSGPIVSKLSQSMSSMFVAASAWVQQHWPEIEPIINGVLLRITDLFDTVGNYIKNNGDELSQKFADFAAGAYLVGTAMIDTTVTVLKMLAAVSKLFTFIDENRPIISLLMMVSGAALIAAGQIPAGIAIAGAGAIIGSSNSMSSLANTGGGIAALAPSGPSQGEQIASLLNSIGTKTPGGGNGANIWSKKIGDVHTNVTINALDTAGGEEMGANLASLVNKEIHKVLDQ